MGKEEISLVTRGRGLQLSTSRVTVQDLVPYFQEGCSHAEIQRWIPTLSDTEISVVEDYYHAHRQALDEEDKRIRERTEDRIRQQRLRFPDNDAETQEQRFARLRELLRRRQERNGEGNLGGH